MNNSDKLYVITKPSGHGGFATWRTPPRGNKGRTRFGLCHRLEAGPPRHLLTLGELETGMTDQDIAGFWCKALRRLHRFRLADAERRQIAQQMIAKGAPLPAAAEWLGAADTSWADVLDELAALIRDRELAA